jgi:hypothetical protein
MCLLYCSRQHTLTLPLSSHHARICPLTIPADGNIGQIGEKIGGPFSSDGAIGSQFDASKDGVAGQVEKAVDGPAQRPS